MIYTDEQFAISRAQTQRLETALSEARARQTDQTWLKTLEIDALKSQIRDIEEELLEYEQLKSGEIPAPDIPTIDELPKVLAKARIRAGISQNALAIRIKTTPEQVQRFEASNYMGASLDMLLRVSRIVGIDTDSIVATLKKASNSTFVWGDVDEIVWSRFPYREMIKRSWVKVQPDENPLTKTQQYFFNVTNRRSLAVYNRRTVRRKSAVDEYALLAWQTRVLELAQKRYTHHSAPEFELNDTWLPELVSLTKSPTGPIDACKFLAKKGITCVIVKHLPGSHLDGATMLYDTNRPIIGLTLRYDRLDNFWFVLLHEIGHIFLHLFNECGQDFFDTESESYSSRDANHSRIEFEADQFALDTLIPSDRWKQCMSRFAITDESVQIDAEDLGIGPSIIAGRIRHERNNYRILNNFVGQGQVRCQFEGVNHEVD